MLTSTVVYVSPGNAKVFPTRMKSQLIAMHVLGVRAKESDVPYVRIVAPFERDPVVRSATSKRVLARLNSIFRAKFAAGNYPGELMCILHRNRLHVSLSKLTSFHPLTVTGL